MNKKTPNDHLLQSTVYPSAATPCRTVYKCQAPPSSRGSKLWPWPWKLWPFLQIYMLYINNSNVVRDKVGRHPGELGVSKSMECDIFYSALWHCWLGDRKGIRPVKNWMLVCWWWWFDWSFARLIAPVVQLSPAPPSSFASMHTHTHTHIPF